MAPILSYAPQLMTNISEMGFHIKFIEDIASIKAENDKLRLNKKVKIRKGSVNNMRFSKFHKFEAKKVGKMNTRNLPRDERGYRESKATLPSLSSQSRNHALGLLPCGEPINIDTTINDVSYFSISKQVDGEDDKFDFREFMNSRGAGHDNENKRASAIRNMTGRRSKSQWVNI